MDSKFIREMPKSAMAANRRIKDIDGGARETPLDYAGPFSERTGAHVLLKGEHLQRTGSFKMRGAMNKLLCLSKEQQDRGVIAASSGNHGIATTQAARLAGLEATIYLPQSVSPKPLTHPLDLYTHLQDYSIHGPQQFLLRSRRKLSGLVRSVAGQQ